ncbi:hypothetical protein E3N88_44786 [Mikania micrantha]|uniref:Protein arginine N-methyltransferase domain-containing protein n=1 Tax=Mikania micrantha TaxID=192012 RepID=A0A5N6LB18_9ASTR|nr:hypothetical protein E3N88_44786 [Mikania micrantha]
MQNADAQTSTMNDARPTKITFQYGDDDEAIEETATGSSNLDEDSSMCEPADDDKTSADYYFDSYSHFGIHEVECSQMAVMAKEIVEANGYSNVITVLKGKIEEIDLPVPQVDIIISEWMGYFLLYENMLNTVLYARDKWLVNNGIVLPDNASLYLTAIEDAEYKEDKIECKKQSIMEPLVDTVDQNQIVTNCQLLKTMDISKMTSGDASFTAPFKLVAERPRSRSTHWKQTVLYLEEVLTICEGESISGSMTVAQNKKNPRDVDITLKYSLNGQRCVISRTQHYKMR